LGEGDIAIDATVGNGFDTCFLSRLIGETGQLIGFDVQQSALEATRQRVESTGLTNVKLLQQGHETLNQQVAENSVSAVMFNLGYLPRHDHKIITQPDTSTQAIKAAIKALKPDGVMTVLTYRGHVGGQEEFEAVLSLLLDSGQHYDLQRIDSTPAKATSPVLFVFRKRQVKEQ
jgi:ubiquinone/menaquinone biosynthesis C-methylase UbiE